MSHTPGPWAEEADALVSKWWIAQGGVWPATPNTPVAKSLAELASAVADAFERENAEMLDSLKAMLEIPCRAQSDQEDCDDDHPCGICNRQVIARSLVARIEGHAHA